MKAIPTLLVCCALPLLSQFCTAQTPDRQGCKDSPLISRFPGSTIVGCKQMDDDSYKFNVGAGKPEKDIEGKFLHIDYIYPKTASKAQVVRNIHTAIKSAGYTFDYDSGDYGDFTVHMGKTWIFVSINSGNTYDETFVTETALTQDVVANAAALSTGLTGNGHVIVNGILFDTGKADVKPESDPALQEVSKMLKENSGTKVYVVGHTDNVGGLAANMELSKRRAAAVVQLLSTKYGVPESQLQPYGDGPYAPVASNDSEDGRTANRRVELVKQ
jgi:outer membrane protein OmpA-like peptidoglycan-associated protein